MGIKGLTPLLKDKAPQCIESISLSQLRDKRIAIDISIFLYKSLSNVRYNGEYLRNSEGKIVSHIVGIFQKTIQYLSVGIQPIYIFDGKPPEEKRECIRERNQKVQECKQKMESEQTSQQEKHKLEKGTIRLTKEHIDDVKHLFDLMGISYIHNDIGEAEAYASELCRLGYVEAVVTEDMDTLAYGCPRMIRNCIDRSIKRKDVVSCFSYESLIKGFDVTPEQFVDICILCGCDYCPTIPKVGPIRAFQYIKQYGSIETMIDSGKFVIPDGFKERFEKSRELFQVFRDKVDITALPLHSSEKNLLGLRQYLIHDCSMGETKVQNALKTGYRITQ